MWITVIALFLAVEAISAIYISFELRSPALSRRSLQVIRPGGERRRACVAAGAHPVSHHAAMGR